MGGREGGDLEREDGKRHEEGERRQREGDREGNQRYKEETVNISVSPSHYVTGLSRTIFFLTLP